MAVGLFFLLRPRFGTETLWFKERGQWQDGSFTPEAGHIIFFDWEGDGLTDHVENGFYLGLDKREDCGTEGKRECYHRVTFW